MTDLRDLYEEMILEHNRNPRNFEKKPEGANHSAHGFNSLCGDDIEIHLVLEDGVVKDIGFDGCGCAISTASTSIMTEAVKGMTEQEVRDLFEKVHAMLTGSGEDGDGAVDVGKVSILKGVREFPMRVKCATLAWHTLVAALDNRKEIVTTE